MVPLTDPNKHPLVVHGTYAIYWKSILKNGLSKMNRNHIRMHIKFSIDFTTAYSGKKGEVLSGMRKSCDTYIELDIKKAMSDGIKFFESRNNVVLTPGIDGIIPKVDLNHKKSRSIFIEYL